jgi:hypothetical protein
MLSSPPQQHVRYLIAHSPSAGGFWELFDCTTYNRMHTIKKQLLGITYLSDGCESVVILTCKKYVIIVAHINFT